MLDTEKIIEIAKNKNGYVTSDDATKLGISRMVLKYLVNVGKLIKLSRGIYGLPNTIQDEFFNEQNRCDKGIFNLASSLYLLGYIEDKPDHLFMSFPQTYNTTKIKARGVICYNQSLSNYGIGAIRVKTPRGNFVHTYCIERTLCEIIKDPKYITKSTIREAYTRYLNSELSNIKLLKQYAKMFSVEIKVDAYLEVLL